MEDEDYAEIVEQLEEFQMDKKQKELVLPSGFDPSIIRMIEDIASRMDLSVVPGKFADQYKVVKKSWNLGFCKKMSIEEQIGVLYFYYFCLHVMLTIKS